MKEIKYCPYCGKKLPKYKKQCEGCEEDEVDVLKLYVTQPHHNDICSTYSKYEPVSIEHSQIKDFFIDEAKLKEEGIYLAALLWFLPGFLEGNIKIILPCFKDLPDKHRLKIKVKLEQEQRYYGNHDDYFVEYETEVQYWPGKNKDAIKYYKEVLEAVIWDIRNTQLKNLKRTVIQD